MYVGSLEFPHTRFLASEEEEFIFQRYSFNSREVEERSETVIVKFQAGETSFQSKMKQAKLAKLFKAGGTVLIDV